MWIVEAALDILKFALVGLLCMIPALKAGEFGELAVVVLLVPMPFFLIGIFRSRLQTLLSVVLMLGFLAGYSILVLGIQPPVGVMALAAIMALTGMGITVALRSGVVLDSSLSAAVITVMLLAVLASAAGDAFLGQRSPGAAIVQGAATDIERFFQEQEELVLDLAQEQEAREQEEQSDKKPNSLLNRLVSRVSGGVGNTEETLRQQAEQLRWLKVFLSERAGGLLFAGLGLLAALGGFISVKVGRFFLRRSGGHPSDFALMTNWRFMRLWTWVLLAGVGCFTVPSGARAVALQNAGLAMVLISITVGLVGGFALLGYVIQQFLKTMSSMDLLIAVVVLTLAAFLFYYFVMAVLVAAGLADAWFDFRRFAPSVAEEPAKHIKTDGSDPDSGSENQGGS